MSNQLTRDPLQERLAAQQNRQAARPDHGSGGSSDSGNSRLSGFFRGSAWQRKMRFLHVYTSMIAFIIILFFGATGLLLNHPEWLGGDELVTELFDGTLPDTVRNDVGAVEFLSVSEFLRSEHGVVGEVTNFDQVGNEGSINYTGPAYGASARFDAETLEYDLRVTEENFINAMRDLHTGDDTNTVWDWVIDISAGFLLFVSVTGLGIQLFMKKRRTKALLWLAGGAVLTLVLGFLTLA